MEKRKEFNFSSSTKREKVATYLDALAKGFRDGTLDFRAGEDEITLSPKGDIMIDVRARVKGYRNKVVVEFRWNCIPDDNTGLEISGESKQ